VTVLDILLIDDDADFVGVTSAVLRNEGHRVFVGRTGVSATAIAAEVCPDVVLLDLRLPDADGYDVARALRRQLPATTAIIVITALPQAIQSDDIDLIVSKPLALELFGGLVEYIRRCRQRSLGEGALR